MTPTCAYCPNLGQHQDHVWPRSRGGIDELSDLVWAGSPCNLPKGALLLTEWDVRRVAYGIVHSQEVAIEYARLLLADPDLPEERGPGIHSLQAWIPSALFERMQAATRATRRSYGDWLMAAFNDVYGEPLERVYPPLPQFQVEIPPPRRTPRRKVAGGRQSVNFRLTKEQVDAIDNRQAELSVESRSEFVTEIVRLGLDGA